MVLIYYGFNIVINTFVRLRTMCFVYNFKNLMILIICFWFFLVIWIEFLHVNVASIMLLHFASFRSFSTLSCRYEITHPSHFLNHGQQNHNDCIVQLTVVDLTRNKFLQDNNSNSILPRRIWEIEWYQICQFCFKQ